MGDTYANIGANGDALKNYQMALEIKKRIQGNESEDVSNLLIKISSMLFALNEYDKSKQLLEDIAITYKNKDKHNALYASAIQHLSQHSFRTGDYDLALTYLKEAIDILDDDVENNAYQLASALTNAGNINLSRGQYNDALLSFDRAYVIIRKRFGNKDIFNAIILVEIAKTLQSLGRYEDAISKVKLAIDILNKSSASNSERMINAQNTLANLFVSLGQLGKAKEILINSYAIAYKFNHSDINFINTAINLGDFYLVSGNYHAASIKYKEALDGIDKTLYFGMPKLPEVLAKYAGSEYMKGNKPKAKSLAYESLSYGVGTTGLLAPLSWLAMIHYSDSPNTSIFILKYVVNLLQTSRQDVAELGSGTFVAYSKSIKDWYHLLAKWLVDEGRLDEARQVLELFKESEHFQFIRRSGSPSQTKNLLSYTPAETQLLNNLFKITKKIENQRKKAFELQEKSRMGLSPNESNLLIAINNGLNENQKELNKVLENKANNVTTKSMTSKSVAKDVSDLQSTLSSLDQDVVLLQYYLSEDELGAIITGPNYQLSRNRAIDSQELHQKITAFNKLLRNPKLDPRPAAQELYKLIFEPIVGDLEKAGAKTVMLYLDGVLRYIPFAALHDGKQYLVEKYRLPIYTAAARDKLKVKITQNWQVAAMGLSESIGNYPALPGVRTEVEGIVLHGKQGVLPGKVYLNKDFTSLSLKEVTKQDFQVMHIASHFVFSPGTEINSFLLLGDGQELTLGDIRTQNFDFSHVELLTLSACETGMGGGKGADGSEIEGFGVIAQRQGAKSVLATLWPVADQSTSILMRNMYRFHQEKNLSKAESLREAQLAMINGTQGAVDIKKIPVTTKSLPSPNFKVDPTKPYAHPFYWAPFILMGNWK